MLISAEQGFLVSMTGFSFTCVNTFGHDIVLIVDCDSLNWIFSPDTHHPSRVKVSWNMPEKFFSVRPSISPYISGLGVMVKRL